jgi:hypothetical protein
MPTSDKIEQFMDVTGASQEAAKFFLDSSGGQVDTAIDQYFATGGEFEAPSAAEELVEEPAAAALLPGPLVEESRASSGALRADS